MLKAIKSRRLRAGGGRFAIVASRYNGRYVDSMVRAAVAELKRAGARAVQVVRVPGAYEIPLVAARLARSRASAHAPRTTYPVISLTLLTPLMQIITALWLEKSAAAYWFRLIILPVFFLLDILTASLGLGESLLGIIWGRRGRD